MTSTRRHAVADLSLFVGALLVRWGFMARWGQQHAAVNSSDLRSIRQVFDGHERLLFDAFLGQPPTPSSQAWPLSVLLHQLMGWVTDDPRAPLLLATVLGSLTAVWIAAAVRRHAPPDRALLAGMSAGMLVAVLPEHVAWSTSATPVVHGLACLAAAFAVRARVARLLFAALAAAFRPELAIPAVFLGWSGGAAVAVAAVQVAVLGGPPGASLWPVLRVNLPLVVFLGPASLGLALLAVRDRTTMALAGLVVVVHCVGACFSDYGSRHALPAAVALCALAALDHRKPWLPLVVGIGLLPALFDLRGRWHHRDAHPSAEAYITVPEDCVEISDEPMIPGQPRPSWVALAAGTVAAPCVVWGEAPEHTEWSSRGLLDRARRMRATWVLSPSETVDPGHGRPWRRTWRLVAGPGVRGTILSPVESSAP